MQPRPVPRSLRPCQRSAATTSTTTRSPGTTSQPGTITGDLFSSQLMVGSTITTGALNPDGSITGARVELGPLGLAVYDSTNTQITGFPLDTDQDAFVKQAHFEMLSADVLDNFTMHGTNNQIATEAELTLSAGVTAPTTAPSVTALYDTVQLDKTTKVPPYTPNPSYNLGTFNLDPSQITCIDWAPNESCWIVLQQKSNGYRYWRFNADGSLKLNLGRPWVDDYNDRYNCFICNDKVAQRGAMFFYLNPNWYIFGYKPDGTSMINIVPASWILDIATRPPGIGYDGAAKTYMLFQNNGGAAGTFHVRRFHLIDNPAGGGFNNVVQDGAVYNGSAGGGLAQRGNGLVFGRQVNAAADRYAWSVDNYTPIYVYDAPNGSGLKNVNGAYEIWSKPAASLGFCHDGSNFWSVDAGGKLTKYTNWNWPENPVTTYVGVSAYDSTAGDGTLTNPWPGQSAGQHETPVGALAAFTQLRRSKLQVTVPETHDSGGADDPNQWKIYYQRAVTPPTSGTAFKLVQQLGSPSAPTSYTMLLDPTGAAPPGGLGGTVSAGNNFPGGNPSRIESSANADAGGELIQLVGDGSGRMGPLAWNNQGVVTSSPVPVGSMMMYGGAAAPPGWLLCQRPVGRHHRYLRQAVRGVGYNFGGSGAAFNLPDMRTRLPLGVRCRTATVGSNEGGSVGRYRGHRSIDPVEPPPRSRCRVLTRLPTSTCSQQTNTTTGGGSLRVTSPGSTSTTRPPVRTHVRTRGRDGARLQGAQLHHQVLSGDHGTRRQRHHPVGRGALGRGDGGLPLRGCGHTHHGRQLQRDGVTIPHVAILYRYCDDPDCGCERLKVA